MNDSAPGWHPDPTLRFELRYHNGRAWTADVSTGGRRYVDPEGTRPSTPPTEATNRPATAALTLGIVAVAIGWMPFVVVLGVIAAVLALVLGAAGRKRARQSGVGGGFALTGLITGLVGLVVCVGGVFLTAAVLDAVDRFQHPADHSASITSCVRDGDEVTARGTLTNRAFRESSFVVRVFYVRPGTDNPRRVALVDVGRVDGGATVGFETTRAVGPDDVDCIVGAVRGPLPYGVDPGS
ncbi:MAG: DUF2510 domain-containing protein [Ilumatobacter sp.]|nr:DUF2510 domain-containing protein [Ilumatobacter sp.]